MEATSNEIALKGLRVKGLATAKQLRPHQWAKNFLIFLPMAAAHDFSSASLLQTTLAFFSFSFLASAVYTLNDLWDLESDRQHPRKRNRPLASGALSVTDAYVLIAALGITSAGLALTLSHSFQALLLLYLTLTCAYSLYLKKVPILDVVLLSGFYVLRIIAGSAASGAVVSQWLSSFSLFFFFSLALAKRYTEFQKSNATLKKRGYEPSDAAVILSLGICSAMLSILILVLYLNSDKVVSLYSHPEWLWFVMPFFLYWTSRLWMLTARGELHDDPLVFALLDPPSLIVGGAVFSVLFASI